jgi:hypothetical protein
LALCLYACDSGTGTDDTTHEHSASEADDEHADEAMSAKPDAAAAAEDKASSAESKQPSKQASSATKAKPATGSDKTERAAAKSLDLPTTKEEPKVAPWFNVYRPEDLAATGKPLPVIAWANGGCYRSDFTWEILFRRWAAGGFVVLALTADPEKGMMVQTTIADQVALIDWAVKQNEDKDSPYFEKLDLEHISAAGNSCGGVTALGVTAQDSRVKATFVLSGSSGFGAANRNVIDKISTPVGYIVGGSADIAGANATSDYDALAEGVPAMIVSRFEGDHRTVSTDPDILTDEAEISLNWLDLALFGSPEAYDELTSEKVCADCEAGHFSLKSKHLDSLRR